MRVTIVGPSLRKAGGQAVQADLLLRHWLRERQVEARFVPVDPEFPSVLGWAEQIPVLRTAIRVPLYWFHLWRALGPTHVAHIFSASYFSFWLTAVPAWAVAQLRGKGTLVNYRSGEARDHLSRSKLACAMLRRMGLKVVPSGYLKDVFAGFGMDCCVIPNLVDTDHIRYRERREVKPILICLRPCELYYAVDDVVRAFGVVQQAYPGAKLLLLGGGSQEPYIRSLANDLHLLNNIEFAGEVPREQVGKYYDRADIFINASVVDNMPVSVLEAFASGTPVVSTTSGGIPYIVADKYTGLLSEPHDWRALGNNVIRLLRDPKLASTIAQNAHEESHQYCWAAVRERWLEVYHAAAGRQEHPVQPEIGEPARPEMK